MFNVFKAMKHSNSNEKKVLMRDGIVDLVERSDDPKENCMTNYFNEHKQILDAKNKVVVVGSLREK